MKLQIGYDVIRSYKRLAYTPWHAFAEFVDNSTQSYFNNKDVLDRAYFGKGEKLTVRLEYNKADDLVRVSDNAMGMSYEELGNAVVIGRPPVVASGRSQFGLGLKTAASWFGNSWSVRTKKLGEDKEHLVKVNIEEVASGKADLPYEVFDVPKDEHYTVIEIRNLNVHLQGRRFAKVKDFLRSMYRVDLRTGVLDIFWNGLRLAPPDAFVFEVDEHGKPRRREFKFPVGGKTVSGWVGVLGEGSSGRPNAGFTIIRRGRVIKGWPDNWRPESIFGQFQGSNDLVNQRIAGEIHLDDFDVTHTKDDIVWGGGEEDELEEALRALSEDLISVARKPRLLGNIESPPEESHIARAVSAVELELESELTTQFVALPANKIPSVELAPKAAHSLLRSIRRHDPDLEITLSEGASCQVHIARDASPDDSFFTVDMSKASVVMCVINAKHPHWEGLVSPALLAEHIRHCLADGLAEWKCLSTGNEPTAALVRLLKDQLLRLPVRFGPYE
jgi:hypothetical protein